MLILNPLNVIWFAVGSVLPIRLSQARAHNGDAAARRELRSAYLGSMPVVAVYCLVASVLAGPILLLLYGDTYAAYGWVVAGAAVIRFIGYHSHLLAIGLRATHRTRPIFEGYVVAAPFSIVAGLILTSAYGIAGALVAMFASHLIWTAVWARAYVDRRGEPAGPWEEDATGPAELDEVPGRGASGGPLS
jgi:O-antigen/teichoic acid export membrane protein